MPKHSNPFVCAECGAESQKWTGQCSECHQWNTLKSFNIPKIPSHHPTKENQSVAIPLADIDWRNIPRFSSGYKELDRVLGGGLLPGLLGLIVGSPGIGKSTLMLQMAAYVAEKHPVLYVSGEESPSQLSYRAQRMIKPTKNLLVFSDVHPQNVAREALRLNSHLVIVDSIQTLFNPQVPGLPGSISQVRDSAVALLQLSKQKGITVWMVGHVTKDGDPAGPRILEHMVDTVLSFETSHAGSIRLLRTNKNRFGRTDELGFLQMTEKGLIDLQKGASLLVDLDGPITAGSALTVAYEGFRSWLVEIQALVLPSSTTPPRRSVDGIELSRAYRLIAVLEKALGLPLSSREIYINVAGGLHIKDRGLDLAICAAIISSIQQKPPPQRHVFIGEVALSGDVRWAPSLDERLVEASRLGIKHAWIGLTPKGTTLSTTMPFSTVKRIEDLHRPHA